MSEDTEAKLISSESEQKRGRPRDEERRDAIAICGNRNSADMWLSVSRGLNPKLEKKLMAMVAEGKTTMTVLAYLAKFPHDQQEERFKVLNLLGARGAKRYVECLTKPPSVTDMARRIHLWVFREFPCVPPEDVTAALRLTAAVFEEVEGNGNVTQSGCESGTGNQGQEREG